MGLNHGFYFSSELSSLKAIAFGQQNIPGVRVERRGVFVEGEGGRGKRKSEREREREILRVPTSPEAMCRLRTSGGLVESSWRVRKSKRERERERERKRERERETHRRVNKRLAHYAFCCPRSSYRGPMSSLLAIYLTSPFS